MRQQPDRAGESRATDVGAFAANSVGRNEQGTAAGTVAAAQGLGVILGPVVGTGLYAIDNGLPFLFMALLLLWPALSRGKAEASGAVGDAA